MTAATAEPEIQNPLHKLTPEQIEAIGKEFDAIHEEVYADLGERDAKYIRGVVALHRRLGLIGRGLLTQSHHKPAWVAGTATLSAAKILENMEIGHNVLHGQWDWMNDPVINSKTWDWDTASTADAWRHSHNYVHHTHTNIRGKDKDLGYEIMRIDPHQPWNPAYLAQPVVNVILMALFEWGVALHDLDFEAIRTGEKSKEQVGRELKGIAGKARAQIVKDYIAWPALSGAIAAGITYATHRDEGRGSKARARFGRALRGKRSRSSKDQRILAAVAAGQRTFKSTVTADVTANVVRNFWTNAIIFCGHFPDQTYTFSVEETENEERGGRYVRQLLGAANIEGSPFFHVASGNLGYQVEHHLFPDMPSTRYARDRSARARHLRALRAAVQLGAVPEAVADGPAHDPAPRLPGREGAPEAGSVPLRGFPGSG